MIHLEQLEKHYADGFCLGELDLRIEAGEIFGIIGRSGAGKSTLLRCINLLERPTKGRVWVGEQELTALAASQLRHARHQIGMVFQHFNLLQTKTVKANVALPLQLMKRPKAEITKKVAELLALVGLADKADYYPGQLSGGQKQRVAIARALITSPKVLLCDEMTSALDPETTQSILQLVQKINKELGLTVVLITHEMEVIKQIADRVAVIEQGKIIELNTVLNVFKQPEQAITQSLVRSTMKLDLPMSLQQKLLSTKQDGLNPVLRIVFAGQVAEQPIISDLLRQFQITFNVLQASLEFIHGETIGVMLATIKGFEDDIKASLAYLQQQQVNAEVIGYLDE